MIQSDARGRRQMAISFTGAHFPKEMMLTGVRWYVASPLSTRHVEELSLSRLNHRLPRAQTHPEVMQGTAEFHHAIADAVLPQPAVVQGLVGELLFQRQVLAARFLHGHQDLHLGQRERQETQILQQPAPSRQRIRRRVSNGLIMGAASIGITERLSGNAIFEKSPLTI